MSRTFVAAVLIALTASGASARAIMWRPPPAPPSDVPLPVSPPDGHFAQPPDGAPRPYHVLNRATVRAALARAREQNLSRFRAYQRRGVFPSNTFEDRKLNVWRDADGHLCAAATIIDASGLHDLVARVADQNNFIRLADVRQGPLMDWILTSGFTQDEIAAIQEPFIGVRRPVQPGIDPVEPVVDPDLRTAEDARLRAKYTQVTRMLVRNERTSLDTATDRLMKRPQLAWALIGG